MILHASKIGFIQPGIGLSRGTHEIQLWYRISLVLKMSKNTSSFVPFSCMTDRNES